ncbi:toll/interleukin-1 receptor domain-containing protein [Sorangium sp. So ce131]|uniref:toll/interleukin-1 receptor domain-containing protein n=1 Tax=Sorangium sp. So ce131 TaxID=3133282 RepID=UPI003F6453BA
MSTSVLLLVATWVVALFKTNFVDDNTVVPGLFVVAFVVTANVVFLRRGAGAVPVVVTGATISVLAIAVAGVAAATKRLGSVGDGVYVSVEFNYSLIFFDSLGYANHAADRSFVYNGLVLACAALQFLVILAVCRRALRGDHRHAGIRQLIVSLRGLGGASLAGADLQDADFKGAQMFGTDLRGAILLRTRFRGARELHWARLDSGDLRLLPVQKLLASGDGAGLNLDGMRMRGVYLRDAQLVRACLTKADLSEADLTGANLQGARLRGADLCGAVMAQASLDGADIDGARIDALAYQRSGFTPELLADMQRRGIEIIGLEAFPEAAQDRLVGEREGLFLCFSTRLSAFDKLLVEGMIVGILGRDTDCYVAEYRVHGDTAIVRLCGSRRADLERVADALYLKVWEQVQVHQTALVRMAAVLQPSTLKSGLDDLFGRRLARMELRDAPPPVAEADRSSNALVDAWRPILRREALLRWTWHEPTRPGVDRIELAIHPRRMFLCHTPADLELARELCVNLSVLHRQGLIDAFRPEDVLPGAVVAERLAERLGHADIVICLISAQFFADEACVQQMERALTQRIQAGTPIVVPVLARPSEWRQSPLGTLHPLPEDGLPVTIWSNKDDAWLNVVSGLRRLLLSM